MRPRKPSVLLDEDSLYSYAVKLLGQQMRTVVELKRLLRRRVLPGEEGVEQLEHVIARLKEQRYLDDSGYAQDYAKLRQENSSFGRRRVQQDLMQKGVHCDLIAKTLETAYENVDEAALAREYIARKRIRKPEGENTHKETARVMGRLLRAGFSAGSIYKVLHEWNIEVDEVEVEEQIEDKEQ